MAFITYQRATRHRVKVWDIGVRLFHWSLVCSVAATYLLADQRGLHRTLGYVVAGLIAARIIWGFVGSRVRKTPEPCHHGAPKQQIESGP